MNDDKIIELAREAGYGWSTADMHFHALQRFARLIRDDYSNKHARLWIKRIEAEREACALLCDDIAMTHDADGYPSGAAIADECAVAIRARGEIK